jgi:hypothetical protein
MILCISFSASPADSLGQKGLEAYGSSALLKTGV